MELVCVGLSHKSAPVELRERLALPEPRQVELLASLSPHEGMVVSTCNRVELYLAAPSPEQASQAVRQALSALAGPQAREHLYEHRGEAALVHLFRVAASLDSMVVGEPQILGQMKDAFERAQRAGHARGELARACAAAFGSAKRVRTETEIGRAAVSMASAAVNLASKIFGGLHGKAVLLVGAGEMAELAGRHLASAGASRIVIANRTLARAEALAQAIGGTARPFEALQEELVQADVVVCSTASPTPVFTRDSVAGVLKPRRHRPLFMVDLAVPRDIAADVNTLAGVYAYDVDDLEKVIAENSAARLAEASKAEVIIAEEVARFSRSRAVREGVPVLAQLRKRAEQIARAEVAKTLGALGEGLSEKQRKSVEAMAQAIVNKLLHEPTAKLRAVPQDGVNRLAGAAAELFGLESAEPAAPAGPDLALPKTGTQS
jgi:glutamyl-tRNA reductase